MKVQMKSLVHLPKELQLYKEPYSLYALDFFVFVLFQTYLFNNNVVLISTSFLSFRKKWKGKLVMAMVCRIGEKLRLQRLKMYYGFSPAPT